ncbi:helix-turn-helix domain-containing protein [Spirosoma aureum]|uniref:Helix-turn-helix domain-containing protein n=1 Tax=Spirosoma aureum TaxID=2692134 RepID=A0A6G9AVX1_9BACT|nr:helix-turn-helix domain-containing protein [Spirosoma aureum]QIP16508.1 helix-turn-helix domain-containing protein [Spirosoma aureum]
MTNKDIPIYTIDTLSLSKQKDIQISRFAPYLAVHKNLHLAHKHDFYHLILFLEGGGTHDIDFHTFPVRPYQIYFMIPGQVHSWSFEGHVDGYVINFSGSFFHSFMVRSDFLSQFVFFNGIVNDSVVDIPEAIQSKVKQYFDDLLNESTADSTFGLDMVRAILIQLFITINRLNDAEKSEQTSLHNYTIFKNFQKLIELNYNTLRLPKEYAGKLFITPNYLNAICRQFMGVSSGEVIRIRIVMEAKRQLVNLDLTVAEIAYKLNFEDTSYFTKFFKKQAGVTPKEFREAEIKRVKRVNSRLGSIT